MFSVDILLFYASIMSGEQLCNYRKRKVTKSDRASAKFCSNTRRPNFPNSFTMPLATFVHPFNKLSGPSSATKAIFYLNKKRKIHIFIFFGHFRLLHKNNFSYSYTIALGNRSKTVNTANSIVYITIIILIMWSLDYNITSSIREQNLYSPI